ncbi:hypothetical protein [Pseudomonas sp. TMP25]|uniref:hypothetical protein n=1 Tax=Pseudomonas sp. TMP25 TaxID=3136561 RepID=UPI003101643C
MFIGLMHSAESARDGRATEQMVTPNCEVPAPSTPSLCRRVCWVQVAHCFAGTARSAGRTPNVCAPTQV